MSARTTELGLSSVRTVTWRAAERAAHDDVVAREDPLEVRVAGDPLAVTMRTPGHDQELVAGLLLSEGLIRSRADLSALYHCGKPGDEAYGNTLDVTLAPGVLLDEARFEARRGTAISASCGVCGRRSIDDLLRDLPPLADARFEARMLAALSDALRDEQPIFARSGGLHAAGIAGADGRFRVVREDIGRHNATDKAIGRLLLDGALPASHDALVVSGRASFEIVTKALRAGIPALVCVSAPSSLAVSTANEAGLLLIGFARSGGFNVYAGEARLVG